MKKQILYAMKRKELYFIITVYPFFFYLTGWIKLNAMKWIGGNINYYGFISLSVMFLILLFAFLEISVKFYGYGIQGDKLKIREKEGISIKEFNNEHR